MADHAGGLGIVEGGMVAAKQGRILFAGPKADAPYFDTAALIDCEGRWITPGLIDSHTHLIHGGNRAAEFEMRLQGHSYEEIARQGGGIASTMQATHALDEENLALTALPRLDALIAEGVTTIEIKSGYGLTFDDEIRMLRAASLLSERRRVRITPTLLAAHSLPPAYKGRPDEFIDQVCASLIPIVAELGVADAVDAFCEMIAFTPAQVERVFAAARANGLTVKLHADQLSDTGGGALAARHGALSADHLEYLSADGVAAMAQAGTVATLLPGAFYFMRETRRPPINELREKQVPIALATDCNPGTSPLTSLLLTMNMAATQFRLTVAECLAGVTRNAALALGLSAEVGTLEAGKYCDLAIWNIEHPAELVSHVGFNPLHARVWRGA